MCATLLPPPSWDGARARTRSDRRHACGVPAAMPTIAEALAEGERALLVGRAAELSLFERWLDHDPRPPEVLEISGPGGIGKSSLLGAFGRIARARGRATVQVDVRSAAGNPAGLLEALGGADAD